MKKPQSLDDIFREEEDKALEQTRAEMARERAAYDALSDAEKAAIAAKNEAQWAALADAVQAGESGDDEEDDDEEDDDE